MDTYSEAADDARALIDALEEGSCLNARKKDVLNTLKQAASLLEDADSVIEELRSDVRAAEGRSDELDNALYEVKQVIENVV